jgi:hypothetical protein
MSAVRFSVVIPTRERAETLRHALRTCLDQDFDDFEVIVSDNCSSPETRTVVDEAGSPKVRYVRTPEPLALSSNWEFGVAHARGEFVTLIGDDDGLLPHGLRELDALARRTGAKAIRWDAAFYTWPSFALAGQGDYLRVPLGRSLRERDAPEAIRAVVSFRECYTALPMIYNAAVRRDVLEELRRRTGRVFPHRYPDVYSGLAVAHVAGRFLSTSVPMSIAGQSGASTGVATLLRRGANPINREFHALNARDGLRAEPTVPDLPVFPEVPVADSFAFARRALFPELDVSLDRRALTRACIAGARVAEADWPAALRLIRDSLADEPALGAWFDEELADSPCPAPPPPLATLARFGPDGGGLNLDASAFGVRDVAGAAELCDRLLGYRDRPPAYSDSPRPASELGAGCTDRERAVLRLHGAAADLRDAGEERLALVNRLSAEVANLQARLRTERRWSLRTPLRAAKRLLRVAGVVS